MIRTIYLADDEPNIRELIRPFLENEGFTVELFETGDALFERFNEKPCNLVILDVMMPGSSGFDICRKIRDISPVPILMLTAKDSDVDQILGYTFGCDDYFIKPVSPIMLTMRVKAMLRRVDLDKAIPEGEELTFGDIVMYPKKKVANCRGEELKLANMEFNVLQLLFEKAGDAVSKRELLEKIWGYTENIQNDRNTRAPDDNIKRIRKKLSDAGSIVEVSTIWGFGYKLALKED